IVIALWLTLADSPWGPGAALGVLLTSALLIRNEVIIPFAVLGAAVAANAIRKRVKAPRPAGRFRITPFLVPVLIALALFLFFRARARYLPILSDALAKKHSLNICQVFAFGYQQRHSDFSASPWTECQQLMLRIYGEPEPSLTKAVHENPMAMLEHFAWNAGL